MRIVTHLLLIAALGVVGCQSSPSSAPAPAPDPAAAAAKPPPAPPPDPRTYTVDVAFEAGSAEVSDQGLRDLREFAGKLRSHPDLHVHVIGTKDAAESSQRDRWLGEQRAKGVASYLIGQGMAVTQVSLQGLDAPAEAADRRAKVTVR